MKPLAALLFPLLFLSLALSGCLDEDTSSGGDNFVFTTIDGDQQELADYRGKIVILDLMGVNCQPCQYQLIELQKISENYSSNEVAILSIDVWTTVAGETADDVKQLKEAYSNYFGKELSWTFGVDDGVLWNNYVINGSVPTLYVFNRQGTVEYKESGFIGYSELKPIIDDML